MIRRQLHHKGRRLSRKGFEFLQNHTGNQYRAHTDKERGNCHQGRISEYSPGKKSDNRHFCSAGNKAGGHYRNLPVPLLLNGPGSQNSRHTTAGGYQHGNDALSGQAEPPQNPIHNKGHPGHIAHILQDAQKQTQNQNLRNKSKYSAYARQNAVHNQAVQPSAYAEARENPVQETGNPLSKQHIVCPVRADCADRERETAHSNGIHQEHDAHKNRQCQNPVCYDPVNPVRQGHTVRRGFFLHCLFHHMTDIGIPLIRDNAFGIIIHLGFAFGNMLLKMRQQRWADPQLLLNHPVTFKQLDGIPAKIVGLHHPLNGFLNMCQSVFHAAGKNMRKRGAFSGFCQFHCPPGGFRPSLPFQRADLHRLAAKCLPQLHKVNGIPVFPDKVNHVHGNHHRIPKFDQLGGQVEVPLNIGPVNHIQDRVGMLLHQVCSGHYLLRRVGGKGVNSGEVLKDHMLEALQGALLLFNGHTGPVPHILIGAGQGIEQRGLSAVRISRQGDFNFHGKHPPIVISIC